MSFDKICRDIKSLKIQGAANVAKAGIKAMKIFGDSSKAKTKAAFLKDLEKAKKKLFATRPTEPAMRNFVRFMLHKVKHSKDPNFKKVLRSAATEASNFAKKAREELLKVGAKRLPQNGIVMTHCHSSTVVGILKEARKMGKRFSVICTETRPRFQGRLTAKDLIKAKIPTTMIIESGMMDAVKKANLILIGADAILAEGSCVNKIGSNMLAFLANEFNTPLFVCSTSWKFDVDTMKEGFTVIEQRSTKEVWHRPPKKLKILNPAFDLVDRQLIDGVITEFGVVAPENIYNLFHRKQGWMF